MIAPHQDCYDKFNGADAYDPCIESYPSKLRFPHAEWDAVVPQAMYALAKDLPGLTSDEDLKTKFAVCAQDLNCDIKNRAT